MNKIGFVMPYFGTFKPSFVLWLESVRRNPEIDWLIFTDNTEYENLPDNVRWFNTTLSEIEKLARTKFGDAIEVNISQPYKLCDFRPFFGLIFEDYIKEYEYWGYGDVDVIYGDLYGYLQKISYTQFDKINRFGHCALIKNKKEINRLPLDINSKYYDKVLEIIRNDNRNFGFDEGLYNEILWQAQKKIYDGGFSADIDCYYERMRCVDKNTMTKICHFPNVTYAPQNNKYQLFVSNNGKILRYYAHSHKINVQEYAYIHFRVEVQILVEASASTYIISRQGFFELKEGQLKNYHEFKELVKKYNRCFSSLVEKSETNNSIKKFLTWFHKSKLILSVYRKIRDR